MLTRIVIAACAVLHATMLIAADGGGAATNPSIRFERDIQPIFLSRCVKCHGSGEAEAGLKLTDRAAATSALDSGEVAILPGHADQSELLRRVTAEDANERMPPEGPPLSAEQITSLRRWIDDGADWPEHWAYRPLKRPLLPDFESQADDSARGTSRRLWDWPLTPIDHFILRKLVENNLAPSDAADKRTLLRRVYFDLIGLPPMPDEIDAFLADDSPTAYEQVVDRLLASPRYGERWARHWMDVVHYAETHGHDQDRPREHAWPYRDYLIRSFNEDKPYSRFVQEQIAGDAMFPGDAPAIVATGMLATGPWDESSLRDIREDTIDREIARYLDRDDIVTTVMSTFASTTVHCARCHDHKFDPITQREYYSLQAVFAATDKANRAYDLDPQVAAQRDELTATITQLPERVKQRDSSLLDQSLQNQVAAWEAEIAESASKWQPVEIVEFRSEGGAELTKLEDGTLLAGGERPDKDTYTLVVRATQQRVTGLRIEVLTHDSLPKSGPGRQDNGNLHLNEIRAWSVDEANASIDQPAESLTRPIELKDPHADFNQDGWSIDKALDGNPATAWGIFPEVGKPHLAVFTLAEPLDSRPLAPRAERDDGNESPTLIRIELQQTHGGGHLIGRLRISTTDIVGPLSVERDVVPTNIAEILRVPHRQRNEEQLIELTAAFLQQKFTADLAALPPQQMVYCGTNQFAADGSFRPAAAPRAVHMLNRGDISQPIDEVKPAALACLSELDGTFELSNEADESQRRAALAQWMTNPNNVLTWRSIANRIWHYHFDRGLVDTPNDFGRMGGTPSHPELLDWLACEMRDIECSGDSPQSAVKHLHRLIVTSSVYRQSSQHNDTFADIDADNRYLWRMNRKRLDAEAVRDAALHVSGTMDSKMGGPSVKQFIQTPGIHVTPNVDYLNFDVNDPANYRRSVYRFVFRTLPDPFMDSLDCPDASQLTPNRNTSLTALQALALLNDKFIVRQSELIADCGSRIAESNDDLGTAPDGLDEKAYREIAAVYRLILGRLPAENEAVAVGGYAEKHGLANACRFLVNSNEFMFID